MTTILRVLVSLLLSFTAVYVVRFTHLGTLLRIVARFREPGQQIATGAGAVHAALLETTVQSASFWCTAVGAFVVLRLLF